MSDTNEKRVVYFDYLRVLAIISVIFLHSASNEIDRYAPTFLKWQAVNIWNCAVRWGVPVFVMISGALFLQREVNIKKLYTKNILRLLISFVVWSGFYAVGMPIAKHFLFGIDDFSKKSMLLNLVDGAYHMWFIPMIIGIYILIPLIKQVVREESTMRYFLIVSFVAAFVIPTVFALLHDFTKGYLASLCGTLNGTYNKMQLASLSSYAFYFVLGYRLSTFEIPKKQRYIIYALGLFGFIYTVGLTSLVSIRNSQTVTTYYSNFNIGVLLEAIFMFVLFKYNVKGTRLTDKLFSRLSKYSFGTYLVHIFILMLVTSIEGKMGVNINVAFSVPIDSLITAVISFAISFVINQIPIINKYIV